jgi:hypothetical protein
MIKSNLQNLHKIGSLRIAFAAIVSVLLCVGLSGAEELSDFEKILRDALQSNRVGDSKKDSLSQPTAPKIVPNRASDSKLTKLREPVPIKTAAKPLSPMPVESNDGWMALTPNTSSDTTTKSAETTPNPRDKQLRIASSARPEIDSNATVWDAVPETVPLQNQKKQGVGNFSNPSVEKNPEPQTTNLAEQNTAENLPELPSVTQKKPSPAATTLVIQPSASPWDTVAEDVNDVNTVKEKPAEIDWNAVANGQNTNKNKSTRPNSAKSSDELSEELSSESKTTEISKPKVVQEDKKSESETESALSENISIDDMNSILNALAKESVKESAKESVNESETKEKETPKEDATKEAQKDNVKKDEKQTKSKKADAEVAEEKEVASDNKTEKAESADGLTEPKPLEKTLSEKEKSQTPSPISQQTPIPDFDSEDDETVWQVIHAEQVGDPHSKDKIKLMYDEIVNGLKSRNITGRYEMWKNYARSTLKSTAGLNTGSELDGRCRLSWYQQLYNETVHSIFAAEEYSRKLHHALSGGHRHLAEIMPDIRKKMDVPERNNEGIRFPECKSPFDALNEVKRCLLEAQMAHARMLATLTSAEIIELGNNLVPTFVGAGCVNGHTIPNRTYCRRLTNLMEKMDKAGQYDAAEALIPLTNTALLALLDKLPEEAFPTVSLSGQKVQRLSTSAGDIIIGGRENNIYDLDSQEMREVVCVIDLGGNDFYREGTCNLSRPIFVTIDLHGNDNYNGTKPGIQAGSVLGVSMLVDAEGDDIYSGGDIVQGSTIGGTGMLFDFAGHDSYKALRRAQGHSLEGLGMLIDRNGNDKYRAAMWAQGFGAPSGFAVLEDIEGNDNYYCGGLYLDSYPEHPGYDGWGQGVGAGIRQVANGGVGILLDGSGDDVYEVDYFGQGGGYWLGVGFVRDFAGNDIRHGSTLMAYNGGQRTQNRWTRFANGFGCHYSLGYCFDDAGNDVYGGTIMGTGMAWDLSIGFLCDFNGSDKFTATGGMTQGVGAEGSIGILYNYGGDDQFMGRNQAYSSSNITYHLPSNCGGNFSFLINYGGNDKYGCGASNNSYVQRGSQGGFLIDRPTDSEAANELVALKALIEKREKEILEYDENVKKSVEEAAAKGRRYVPRQRRPLPISADQQQRLGAVPDFGVTAKTSAVSEGNVK